VVSFTHRPLYPRGKSPRDPLNMRLGGSQCRSGRRGEEKILYPTGIRTPTLGHPVRSQYVYQLRYPGSFRVQNLKEYPSSDRVSRGCISRRNSYRISRLLASYLAQNYTVQCWSLYPSLNITEGEQLKLGKMSKACSTHVEM
jgi:hypothetical protein